MKNNTKNLNVFRTLTLVTLAALVLEYVLGMVNALFVQFPDTLVNGNAWAWAMQASPMISVHVAVGSLLVLLMVATVVFGMVACSKPAILWSVVGLILTLAAYMGGSVFLSNVADGTYSFVMALGFIGSLLAYGVAFYQTRLPGAIAQS